MIVVARALLFLLSAFYSSSFAMADPIVKNITIRADRDIGYFIGDLVSTEVEVRVPDGWELRKSSLPHEGPVDYWLDLRKLDIQEKAEGGDRVFVLKLLYQNFYDAFDVRSQEIPSFPLYFSKADQVAQGDVPAWTISVSPLREIAPPPQNDPKDYMRPDTSSSPIQIKGLFETAVILTFLSLLTLLTLCYKLSWWPFRPGPKQPFTMASRQIARLRESGDTHESYLHAILILHRGFDSFVGKRLLAEDVQTFVKDHPQFLDVREALLRFFEISREAFFKSDPDAAQRDMPFASLKSFADSMAQIEKRA